jgi:hypothetical protein
MVQPNSLPPPDEEHTSSGSEDLNIVDCGTVRERTHGAPVGFSSEAGWPPYIRYLGA